MKTIHKVAMASAVALSSFAVVVIAAAAAQAGPIVPPGHYCITYDTASSDVAPLLIGAWVSADLDPRFAAVAALKLRTVVIPNGLSVALRVDV